ncbi:MAG: septum formation protein Maf [Lachnospiraceae bacterium]|nr:septum formation protein Maf [Lachnospiraceae bacterium]
MKIILASASPRRRELLHQIGWNFEICVSQVEEKITKTLPWEVVEELSCQKAEDVFVRMLGSRKAEAASEEAAASSLVEEPVPAGAEDSLLVIGADTIVACDGRILGKPADREDAVAMLKLLQGRSHYVYTGVTLCLHRADGESVRRTFHEATEVNFYPMTEEEIQWYVDSGEPMDKAGSYGIQGLCARYISGIAGDYNNVVGLPVGRLYQEVQKLGGIHEESSHI